MKRDADTQEIIDRLRRVETRVTKFLETQGFDTEAKQPKWHNGRIEVPSPDVSLKKLLRLIPNDWDRTVTIALDGEPIAMLVVP